MAWPRAGGALRGPRPRCHDRLSQRARRGARPPSAPVRPRADAAFPGLHPGALRFGTNCRLTLIVVPAKAGTNSPETDEKCVPAFAGTTFELRAVPHSFHADGSVPMADNPFFETWNTPFELPPFERIRPEHFPPAFERGMAEHEAEIAAIAGSGAAPDFANTIEALERSGRLLRRVSRVFNNLDSSATNEALQAIDRDYAPKLAAQQIRVALDPGLFARIDALYQERDNLALMPEQRRVLERHHLRLVRSG